MEPSLVPPFDRDIDRIGEYVDELTLTNLVSEIQSKGLDEKAKEIILAIELPNANDFMQEIIAESNLEFLLKLCGKKAISDIRETLIDYLYWRQQ